MNRAELFERLKTVGLPVAYRQWAPAKPPPLPYLIYFFLGDDDLKADGINYASVDNWCIELYSAAKDDEDEAKVEQVLTNLKIPYSKNEIGKNTDGLFESVFYFTTIGG